MSDQRTPQGRLTSADVLYEMLSTASYYHRPTKEAERRLYKVIHDEFAGTAYLKQEAFEDALYEFRRGIVRLAAYLIPQYVTKAEALADAFAEFPIDTAMPDLFSQDAHTTGAWVGRAFTAAGIHDEFAGPEQEATREAEEIIGAAETQRT